MAADATSASTEALRQVQCPANGEPRDAATLLGITVQPIADSLRWLWARLQDVVGKFAPLGALIPSPLASVDTTADTITLAGHGLSNGDIVRFRAVGAGAPPAPLSTKRRYFVVGTTSNTFQVAATRGGSAIDITGSLSGSVYVAKIDPAAATPQVHGSAALTPTTSTLTPDNAGSFDGGTFTTVISEPVADAVLSLAVASGPMPGARWRFHTTAAFVTHKVQFKSEGGSIQATFPTGGSLSWCEFEFETGTGSGWFLCAWGGSTTTP